MNFLFATYFLFLVLSIKSDGYDEVLRFPENVSTNNYIMFKPDLSKTTEQVSVCYWMKKYQDPNERHYMFSYAITGSDNEILFSDNMQYHHIAGKLLTFPQKLIILKHEWYHFCLTWHTAQQMNLYINGVLVAGAATPPGWKITSGGTLVLGQDQDSVGGGFEIKQTFGGELYQLNVFKRKLSLEEIVGMYYDGRCADLDRYLRHDVVLSWEEILSKPRRGAVSVVSGGCNKWDILNDFTGQLVDHLNRRGG